SRVACDELLQLYFCHFLAILAHDLRTEALSIGMRSMNSVTDSSNSHVQIVCVICNESIFTDVLAIEFSSTGNVSVHAYGTRVYDGVTRDGRPTCDIIDR